MLFLFLFALSQQPAAGAQASPQETPRWVLAGGEFQEGDVVEGWIVLSPPTSTGAEQGAGRSLASVTLEAPSNVDVWFAPEQKDCRSPDQAVTLEARRRWKGHVPEDGLLKVCARAEDDLSFLLMAVIKQHDDQIHTISSDKVSVQSSWKLDPTILGVLTTAIGFLTGLIGYIGQKFFDRWLSLRDTRKTIVKTVTEMLAREIHENREKLSRYIEGKELDPPILAMGQYVALLGDEGAMSFLNGDERKGYFPKIESLYAAIGDFNDAVNDLLLRPEAAESVLKSAKLLRHRLGNIAGEP